MSRRPVPVTLPRARLVIDGDGRLEVTVDSRPWPPSAQPGDADEPIREGTVRLGRSDVVWAQRQIADELDTPVLVEVVDDGQTYIDVIDPGSYKRQDPKSPDDRRAGGTPQGPEPSPEATTQSGEGRYAPGEPVVIAAVVVRTHADEHGVVHFRLPTALSREALLVHGETSGMTIPFDHLSRPGRSANSGSATEAPGTPDASDPVRPPLMDRNLQGRRRGPRPTPSPGARTTPADPDAALGSL